ncbi:MAG: glutaredoxin family protein [Sulfuriferula sp.]
MKKILIMLPLAAVIFQANASEVYRWVDKAGAVHYSDQAPTSPVKKLEQRKLETNVIDGQGSYVMKDAATKNPVTLYAGDCGPLCANAKALLEKRGIPYAMKDPQNNKADADALNALTGAMELPVLKIGNNPIKGFEPTRWNQMLDEAGYPKTKTPGERKIEVKSEAKPK